MEATKVMNIIRWTARIIGTVLVIACLIIFVAYVIDGAQKSGPGLATFNIFLFTILGIGLASLILALWKEGLGGIISLMSFIAFNILAAVNPVEGSGYVFMLLIFLAPSILYILYWWLKRNSLNKEI